MTSEDAAARVPALVVIPAVAVRFEDEAVTIDDKLFEGLVRYCDGWNGTVLALCHPTQRSEVYATRRRIDDLPFEILPFDLANDDALVALRGAAVILAAADDHRQLTLARVTPQPIVYVIEYTLHTRLQQIALGTSTNFRKLRSVAWTLRNEQHLRAALRDAAGLQTNGAPAYNQYASLNANTLLYHDTRVGDALRVRDDELVDKTRRLVASSTLRLAYSGRLERIKGAHHLVAIARLLEASQLDFVLDIYGTGSLADDMRREVLKTGLGARVFLHGPVDFASELLPKLRECTDLFICCHLQADPACTYLETLACGVPIAGYRNAAFSGVLELGDVGAQTGERTPAAMARLVEKLSLDRHRLAAHMVAAAHVGREHGFERVFKARSDQLAAVAASELVPRPERSGSS